MAQFDLYHLAGGQLVVDLQTDLIGIEASRIVAPLRDAGQYAAFPGLTPHVEVDGATWIGQFLGENCDRLSDRWPTIATR